ncbi:ATP-binding protein [Streptomyces sp. NPDC058011]|uniref:ATP-binding protein n=1 Tax=Streptomyces sp. NPDC058011 TaxID=3346305 RepID=UPI0036E56572
MAGMIPLEIGNLALSNPPDWGLALGVSAAGFAAMSLNAEDVSGARVRAFTRSVMDQWGVAESADAAVAVAWELAASAMRPALSEDVPPVEQPDRAWLGLVRRDEAVICAVTDDGPSASLLQKRELLNDHGLGLQLVDCLSSHWGWSRSPSGTKTVWARVPAAW